MKVFINDRPMQNARLMYNDGMNYSQFQRIEPDRIFTYRIEVEIDPFIAEFSGDWDELVAEIKEIDAQEGPEYSEFAAMGYTNLRDSLKFPKLLGEAMDDYMMRDVLFPKWCPIIADPIEVDPEASKWPVNYIVNSMERFEVKDRLLFHGRGYINR